MSSPVSHPNSRSTSWYRWWSAGRRLLQSLALAMIPLGLLAAAIAQVNWDELAETDDDSMSRLMPARFSEQPIRQLELAADGRSVWITRFPATLQQVDLTTGATTANHTFPGVFSGPLQFTSPALRSIIYGSERGIVRQSYTHHDQTALIPTVERQDVVYATNPHRDELIVAQGTRLEVWSLVTMTSLTSADRPHIIARVQISSDGTRLLVYESDGQLSLVDSGTLKTLATHATSLTGNVRLLMSREGGHAVAFSDRGTIVAWDLRRDEITSTRVDVGYLRTVALSPDGQALAYIDAVNQVWLVRLDEASPPQCLGTTFASVNGMIFDASGTALLLGGLDATLERWSVADGTVEWSIRCEEPSQKSTV